MSKKAMSEDKDLQNNEENTSSKARVYEVGYLLIPSLAEDEVPTVYGNLKDTISSLGGVYISDEMPKMIDLAYEMLKVTNNVRSRFNTAYFGWIKFDMDAEKIGELKSKLDLDPNFLRFLIIKTVRESTIATKKFGYKEMGKRKPYGAKREGEEAQEATPINKEEIDKEIDALVSA